MSRFSGFTPPGGNHEAHWSRLQACRASRPCHQAEPLHAPVSAQVTIVFTLMHTGNTRTIGLVCEPSCWLLQPAHCPMSHARVHPPCGLCRARCRPSPLTASGTCPSLSCSFPTPAPCTPFTFEACPMQRGVLAQHLHVGAVAKQLWPSTSTANEWLSGASLAADSRSNPCLTQVAAAPAHAQQLLQPCISTLTPRLAVPMHLRPTLKTDAATCPEERSAHGSGPRSHSKRDCAGCPGLHTVNITAQRLHTLLLGACPKLASVQLQAPALTRLDAHACHQQGPLDQPFEMTLRCVLAGSGWGSCWYMEATNPRTVCTDRRLC